MNVSEYVELYPEYGFDWAVATVNQKRMYRMEVLDLLPAELEPIAPYIRARIGHPNVNQTKLTTSAPYVSECCATIISICPPHSRRKIG